jgi:hypothetical protein
MEERKYFDSREQKDKGKQRKINKKQDEEGKS